MKEEAQADKAKVGLPKASDVAAVRRNTPCQSCVVTRFVRRVPTKRNTVASRAFPPPTQEDHTQQQSPHTSPALQTSHAPPAHIGFPIMDILYKWNPTVRDLPQVCQRYSTHRRLTAPCGGVRALWAEHCWLCLLCSVGGPSICVHPSAVAIVSVCVALCP